MKNFAIIVAGGTGSRMQSEIPKQFMLLAGKPVLMHTIEAFAKSDSNPEIIIVLNVHFHQQWEKLCKEYEFIVPFQLVKAGETRFQSVKNGLKLVKTKSLIAVHDAVRPLISSKFIDYCFSEAEKHESAIPVIPCSQSLRKLDGVKSSSLDRKSYVLVQTPQIFTYKIITKSYNEPFRNEFTDDASVVEFAGNDLHLVKGEESNIKITYPIDLVIANAILTQA